MYIYILNDACIDISTRRIDAISVVPYRLVNTISRSAVIIILYIKLVDNIRCRQDQV